MLIPKQVVSLHSLIKLIMVPCTLYRDRVMGLAAAQNQAVGVWAGQASSAGSVRGKERGAVNHCDAASERG